MWNYWNADGTNPVDEVIGNERETEALVSESVCHLLLRVIISWFYESANQVFLLITHIVKATNLGNFNKFPY